VGAHWFLDQELAGGGIIMDMGQYFMDAVLNMAGWPKVESVSAVTFRGFDHDLPPEVRFDVEEQCTFLARTEDGPALLFDLAWIAHQEPVRRVVLMGTEGGIRMDRREPFTFFGNKGGPWNWMNTTTDWKDDRHGNDVIYSQMVEVLRGEREQVGTTPQQALAITELTQMALRSGKEGREVRRDELE
jgi:predicted dehydrogenase